MRKRGKRVSGHILMLSPMIALQDKITLYIQGLEVIPPGDVVSQLICLPLCPCDLAGEHDPHPYDGIKEPSGLYQREVVWDE